MECTSASSSGPSSIDNQKGEYWTQPGRGDLVLAAVLTENKSSDESVACTQNLCHQQESDTWPLSVSQHPLEPLTQTVNKEPSCTARPFRCTKCGQFFNSEFALRKHREIHWGERPYECMECDKSFTMLQQWKRHQVIHSPYNCTQCCKSFQRFDTLKHHQHRIHEKRDRIERQLRMGERRFVCVECGKSFRTNDNLRQHEAVHAGQKPYKCNNCDKSFPVGILLKYHRLTTHQTCSFAEGGETRETTHGIKSHRTGESLYSCQQCDRSFTTIGFLKGHRRLRHSSQPQHYGPVQAAALAENKTSDVSVASMQNLGHQQEPDTGLVSISQHKLQSLTQNESAKNRHLRSNHCKSRGKAFGKKCNLNRHRQSMVCQTQSHRNYGSSAKETHLKDTVDFTKDTTAALPEKQSSDESISSVQNLHFNQQELDAWPLNIVRHDPIFQVGLLNSDESTTQAVACDDVSQKKNGRTRTGERSFQCTKCNWSFTLKQHLTRHRFVHTNERPYRCMECGKAFKQRDNLKCHLLYYHQKRSRGERRFVCAECDKSFTFESNLKIHQLLHTGERDFTCAECGKSFLMKNDLKQHETIHTGERPYKCTKCDKSFRLRNHFRRHERTQSHARLRYECTECGRSFGTVERLESHMSVHTGARPLDCAHCGKSFSGELTLRKHLKTHTIERQYECRQCSKSFTTTARLDDHKTRCRGSQREHWPVVKSNVTPVQAGAQVESSNTLPASILTHKCAVCSEAFRWKNDLNRHLMVHVRERPHWCTQCSTSFCFVEQLHHHQQQVHGQTAEDLVHQCERCLLVFAGSRSVREHVLALHVPVEAQFGCGRCTSSFEFVEEAKACFHSHRLAVSLGR